MDTARLAESPIGNLIEITGTDSRFQEEYRGKAYLPDPLPHAVPSLAGATYARIARTAASVARADQAVKQLPNPSLLVRPAIRREAVSTSALEGTYAAFTDVLEADFLGDDEVSSEVAEVRNFVVAAEAALEWIKDRPITLSMLEHLQKILVRGTRADTAEAGHIRTTQVLIGVQHRRVEEARFVPPPPGDHLRDGCLAWERWIQSVHDLHPVAASALAHYQFETLHPFNDGNGRLGRLVALLQLITADELESLVVNLSPWLKERESEYQAHLLEVSASGDFDPWVAFFCEALCAHASEAVDRVHDLLALRQELLDRANKARVRGVGLLLTGDLIGFPMVTARTVAELYEVSPQAANNAVTRLTEIGILRQRTKGRYARIFSCDPVLYLLDRP